MIEMNANLEEFFKKQQELDTFILESKGLELDNYRKNQLTLALFDEVCELLNKTRVHKFWSNKGMDEKAVLIEEYVDTWHFLLSVGNSLGVCTEHSGIISNKTFVEQFRAILFTMNDVFTPIGWTLVVSYWKGLGHMLGFTDDEVKDAYNRKYEINIQRQKEGY
ncbi:dUTPase [Bacillus phage 031MP004]|nr:dUTPase [Bacillus phage 031MP004]